MVNFNHIQPAGWCPKGTRSFGGAKSTAWSEVEGISRAQANDCAPAGSLARRESAAFGMTTREGELHAEFPVMAGVTLS